MQKNNSTYTYTYVLILSLLVALSLSVTYSVFKPIHDDNEAFATQKDLLSAALTVGKVKNMSKSDVEGIFKNQIKQVVLDANGKDITATAGITAEKIKLSDEKKKEAANRFYPLFIYSGADGKQSFIVSVRGKGLWDEIWGWLSINGKDMSTIEGVSFDHKGETPGLGAEIKDNPVWFGQFYTKDKGNTPKRIFDDAGNYVSVAVVKGGLKSNPHAVDAISGSTMTGDGLAKMLKTGLEPYALYFKSLKK